MRFLAIVVLAIYALPLVASEPCTPTGPVGEWRYTPRRAVYPFTVHPNDVTLDRFRSIVPFFGQNSLVDNDATRLLDAFDQEINSLSDDFGWSAVLTSGDLTSLWKASHDDAFLQTYQLRDPVAPRFNFDDDDSSLPVFSGCRDCLEPGAARPRKSNQSVMLPRGASSKNLTAGDVGGVASDSCTFYQSVLRTLRAEIVKSDELIAAYKRQIAELTEELRATAKTGR